MAFNYLLIKNAALKVQVEIFYTFNNEKHY